MRRGSRWCAWRCSGVVCVLLVGISALACWIPARRATGIDPSEALRAD